MAKNPRILQNMSLGIEGVGYAGIVKAVTPPVITRITEDHRAGGMDGTLRMDLGQEAMEMTLRFAGTDHELLKHIGLMRQGAPISLRTANQAEGGEVDSVVYKATGNWSAYDLGELTPGTANETTITAQLSHFEIIDAGEEVLFIDVPNMVCRIRGADMLKDQRDALGV